MYLSGASGNAPFNRDWTDIFVHEVALVMGEGIYDMLNERSCQELSSFQKQEVEDMKHKVRASQIRNEPKLIKGGEIMPKTKILIEEKEDGCLIGVSRDGVDPYVKKMELPFPALLDLMPFVKGIVSFAEEQWKIQPKNPSYTPPPAAVKKESKTVNKKKVEKTEEKSTEEKPTEPGADYKPEPIHPEKTEPQKVVEKATTQEPGLVKTIEKIAQEQGANKVLDEAIAGKATATEETASKPEEKTATNIPPAPEKRVRVSSNQFQYRLKADPAKGPFGTIQAALDAMGMDKFNRPTHNRYDRLSKKLQTEIIQEEVGKN